MDPLSLMIAAEDRDSLTASIHGAISALPETERLMFRMIHVEGFSERDTARCTAMSRPKVRRALARAQSMLRARLA